jgi:hypothetical protein
MRENDGTEKESRRTVGSRRRRFFKHWSAHRASSCVVFCYGAISCCAEDRLSVVTIGKGTENMMLWENVL